MWPPRIVPVPREAPRLRAAADAAALRSGRTAETAATPGLRLRLRRLRHRLRRGRRGCGHDDPQLRAVGLHVHADRPALVQLAEEDLLRERLLHLVLDEPRHRARAHLPVEAVLGEPHAAGGGELDADLLLGE